MSDYSSIPETITPDWARAFSKDLEQATWRGPAALGQLLPRASVSVLLEKAFAILKAEPTLVEVNPAEQGASVTVVGDTHGQVHDVLNMLQKAGEPSETRHYVFNGDFVDRGVWGLEVLLVLVAWKLALPRQVIMLRGNHETTTCTLMYGFRGELEQKYAKVDFKPVYSLCKKLFSMLPLAARIGSTTLVLHGGLFRKPSAAPQSKKKRKRNRPIRLNAPCDLGSLEDLRAAGKGGLDPNGRGSTVVATDVLWSDPVATGGLEPNTSRGVGVVFGPDVTQRFLVENGLRLVLRSHEGPDARFERDDMPSMQEGWTTDHVVEAGRLLTVFSAPDYPQFQAEDSTRYGNLAAVAVLRGPEWCHPEVIQYAAILPRPAATACYDYIDIPGSDEEIEIAGSEQSQGSAGTVSDLEDTAAQPDTPSAQAEPSASQDEAHTDPGEQAEPPTQPTQEATLEAYTAAGQPQAAEQAKVAPDLGDCVGPNRDDIDIVQPSSCGATQPAALSEGPSLCNNSPGEYAAAMQIDPSVAVWPSVTHPEQTADASLEGSREPYTCSQHMHPRPSKGKEGEIGQTAETNALPDSQVIHQTAQAVGRELEQAAAQTLAVSGGLQGEQSPDPGALKRTQNGTDSPQAAYPTAGHGGACEAKHPVEPLPRVENIAPPKKTFKGNVAAPSRTARTQNKAPWR